MPTAENTLKELIKDDRRFIETLFVVEDKSRRIVPFIYNDIQADVDSTETGMDIWVKPAQVGFSTERIAKRLKDTITSPGTNTILVAYEDFITERLLTKVQFFYNHLAGLNIPGFPELFHNCLPYHVKVQLANGEFRQIGQIVNKREPVEVLSCNLENGDIEPKAVTNWFKYPSKHLWIVLGSGHKFSHMVTPDHPIYCSYGYKLAGNVEIGDTTYHNGFIPNDDQKQLIAGSLLGDASLHEHGGVNFGQANKEYAEFKHSILQEYATPLKTIENRGYSNNPFHVFMLASSPLFGEYSYQDLTPAGLAIWYCDDGNLSGRSVSIHTESFSLDYHYELVQLLRNKFSIEATVVRNMQYWKLSIPNPRGSGNQDRFFSIIAPYVPECMNYKLPEKYRGSNKYQWDTKFGFGLIPYKVAVKDIALTSDKIYNYQYSIEVEDNHNFFTSVGLVANSTYEKTFKFYVNDRIYSTSSIYIASARSYVAGRAETIHHLLFDEFAFYPPGALDNIVSPALDRVPVGGTVDIYSTPNGEENDFYQMYQLAKDGKSSFKPHFYPWFMHKEYRIVLGDTRVARFIPETSQPEFRLSAEEENLVANRGLTFDQIRWRRWKIKEKESLGRNGQMVLLFQQEFPEDDVSCFLATGNMLFEDYWLDKIAKQCYPGQINSDGLEVWYPYEKGKQHIVSIDPGQAKVTQSAITVLCFDQDSEGNYKPKLCARDAGLYSPEITARKAVLASDLYGRAMIVWEANSHGLAITELLKRRRPIYYRKDIVSGMPSMEPGWLTTSKNRDYLLQQVSKYLPDLTCHDIELVKQMRNHRLIGDKVEIVGLNDIFMSFAIGLVCLNPKPMRRGFIGKSGWRW